MTAPCATYRLQFRNGMTFDRAAEIVPYLAALGVSHLYASPIAAAVTGSSHGYDVTDHGTLDPALGGEAGFARLAEALRHHDMRLVLDIVPNHMAASPENPWWRDVLMWGAQSPFAGHFDIDWTAPKLLLPILGEPYGEALAQDKLALNLDQSGTLALGYFEAKVPLSPPTWAPILQEVPGLESLAQRFAALSPRTSAEPLQAFRDAIADTPTRTALESALMRISAARERMHAIHEAQPWRLAYWRLAREALTYRRFFEIAELVGVRVEDSGVFADVHALPVRLVKAGIADGLRVDHVDGLADPKAYLTELAGASGADWVLVEKILAPDETLRADWACAGTTGYEVARLITGLQIDSANAPAMTAAWVAFTGEDSDFDRQVTAAKRRILAVNLAGELDRLTDLAHTVAGTDLVTRDLGRDALRRAILELAVAIPVYRSYLDANPPSVADRSLVEAAAEAVARDRETEDARLPAFIADVLLTRPAQSATAETFAQRFQQTTAALTAKAVEDTVFYRFNRLIALNEVGAEPAEFGIAPEDFHRAMARRADNWPRALSATATHDTKRGEDARARLAVLNEMPGPWAQAVARWHDGFADLRRELPLGPAPGARAEWLFYQALAGAWPAELELGDEAGLAELADRLDGFMTKALREAKRRTSWTDRNEAFEAAVSAFVRGALAPERRALLADIATTLRPVVAAGLVNSLAQLTLKLTLPGVPDIYQGTELFDVSLVDPDNRRPVDFAARRQLLDEAAEISGEAALARWREGLPKLWLMHRLIALRRKFSDLFATGAYEPVAVEGPAAAYVVAFARRAEAAQVVVAVPRLVLALMTRAGDVPLLAADRLAETHLKLRDGAGELITLDGRPAPVDGHGKVSLADLWATLPLAVLAPRY